MNISEIFLIVWASIATGLAIYYHQGCKMLYRQSKVMESGLVYIARGEARVFIRDNKLVIEEV